MKRSSTVLNLFIFCIAFTSIQHLALSQDEPFETKIFPSLMDSKMDGWYKIPPNTGPQIHKVSKVYKDQEFKIFLFFRNYEADTNSKVNIQYDLQLLDPGGNPTKSKANGLIGYQGRVSTTKSLLLNQQFTSIVITDEDEYGTYTIKVTAHDNVANTSVTSKETIELIPFELPEPFKNEEDAGEWTMEYYKKINPIKAVNAVQQLVQLDRQWMMNKIGVIHFFTTVYENNPFLFKNLIMDLESYSIEDQKKFILISILSKDRYIPSFIEKSDNLELKNYYDHYSKMRLPDVTDLIVSPYQLDMLWSEFLSTGKYDPILKIVNSLILTDPKKVIDKLKKDDPNIDESKISMYLMTTLQSAKWSLKSNCKQIPLVSKYCEYIYANEKLETIVKDQLRTIISNSPEKNDEE